MNFVLVFAHCIVSEIYWRVLAEIPPRVIYYPSLKNTCTSYFLHVFSFFFLLIKCGLACSRNYLRGWVIIVVIELNLGVCSYIASIQTRVRPKPLFWFRSNTETETQVGRYFQPIPQPIPKPHFKGKILWGIFLIIKGPLKPNLQPNIKNVLVYFWRSLFNFKLLKIYLLLKKEKEKFQFRKRKFRLQYRYWNWTLVSVAQTCLSFSNICVSLIMEFLQGVSNLKLESPVQPCPIGWLSCKKTL